MYGIDISNYQSKIDLSTGIYDFCIVKATEGVGYTSPSFHIFISQLTKLNKLMGAYHFARPDLNGTQIGMMNEADSFIEALEKVGILGKAILVLDWEVEPMDREDLIDAWVTRVESQTGVTPFIYGSKSKLTKWKDYWAVKHCPIWMAAWSEQYPRKVGELIYNFPSKSTVNWKIWQYKQNGIYPGFSGNVDLDYSDLTEEQWLSYAKGKREEPEEILPDMQWAINNGLFVGDGEGHYMPKDPLTREQAATLFKKFYDKFNK